MLGVKLLTATEFFTVSLLHVISYSIICSHIVTIECNFEYGNMCGWSVRGFPCPHVRYDGHQEALAVVEETCFR